MPEEGNAQGKYGHDNVSCLRHCKGLESPLIIETHEMHSLNKSGEAICLWKIQSLSVCILLSQDSRM